MTTLPLHSGFPLGPCLEITLPPFLGGDSLSRVFPRIFGHLGRNKPTIFHNASLRHKVFITVESDSSIEFIDCLLRNVHVALRINVRDEEKPLRSERERNLDIRYATWRGGPARRWQLVIVGIHHYEWTI